MNTPIIDQDTADTDTRITSIGGGRRRHWTAIAGVAAAAVAVAVAAAVIVNSGADDDTDIVASPPLELSLGESNAMAMCMVFDVSILADMSPAFAGTATAVDGETVTLDVDRWYAGGDAATVVLEGAAGSPALIDGFTFETGRQYLITAADGNVNFCGYSGLATPELTRAFDQAFGG